MPSMVRLVSAIAAAGVRRQDRIAVLSRNSVEFGEVMAAAQLSGIIMATVNFRLSPPEVFDVLRRVKPSIVFYGKEFEATVAELAPRLPVPPLLVSMGGPEMTTQLAALKASDSWKRDDLIDKAGWTTPPGIETPVQGAANLCTKRLLEAKAAGISG